MDTEDRWQDGVCAWWGCRFWGGAGISLPGPPHSLGLSNLTLGSVAGSAFIDLGPISLVGDPILSGTWYCRSQHPPTSHYPKETLGSAFADQSRVPLDALKTCSQNLPCNISRALQGLPLWLSREARPWRETTWPSFLRIFFSIFFQDPPPPPPIPGPLSTHQLL